MQEIGRKSRGSGACFKSYQLIKMWTGLLATTHAFILYINWNLKGRPEKLYRDDPRTEFDGPAGANPGLVAMTTHMLRLQLIQD